MSSNLDRFSPEEKSLIRAKEEAQKRLRGAIFAGRPSEDWAQRVVERTAALLAYRQAKGLLTETGKRIPYRAAKAPIKPAPKKKKSAQAYNQRTVQIVPIDLTMYETEFEKEQAARRCSAVRFAVEKQQAAEVIKARREANKMRVAAIAAAAPKKPLYANWE